MLLPTDQPILCSPTSLSFTYTCTRGEVSALIMAPEHWCQAQFMVFCLALLQLWTRKAHQKSDLFLEGPWSAKQPVFFNTKLKI